MPAWPMREVTDPRMLRAMAHPLRLKLINDLVINGPSTATELAERHAESAANCSWHLRQLAKFGYIEDLPGQGRNRPWRWVPTGNQWGHPDDPPEMKIASKELTTSLLALELAARDDWEAAQGNESAQWQTAAFITQSIAWLTPAELEEIGEKIRELMLRNIDRLTDPHARPEGARPVRFVAWGNPAV